MAKVVTKKAAAPAVGQFNKSDIVDAIAKSTGLPKTKVSETLDAFKDVLTAALKKGKKFQLTGFFTATVVKRAARKGRNPATGKPINIPEKKVVKLTAGKKLKDDVK